jgi:hypothetical protein
MRKNYIGLFFVFIAINALFPLKGAPMSERPDYKTQIKEKYKKIDLSDGVSKEEAIVIAQNYLIEQGRDTTCDLRSAEIFGENDRFWDKNSWHISFNTTLGERLKTGINWITIHIEKQTGRLACEGGGPS